MVASRSGFTLIELMVVMSIIVILAGIGVSVYANSVTRAKEAVLKEDLYRLRDAIVALKDGFENSLRPAIVAEKHASRREINRVFVAFGRCGAGLFVPAPRFLLIAQHRRDDADEVGDRRVLDAGAHCLLKRFFRARGLAEAHEKTRELPPRRGVIGGELRHRAERPRRRLQIIHVERDEADEKMSVGILRISADRFATELGGVLRLSCLQRGEPLPQQLSRIPIRGGGHPILSLFCRHARTA